jgi:HSP20 family protein
MDTISRKLIEELEEMQEQTGRMLRNMALARMVPVENGRWQPQADVYEAETEYLVYFDLAGIDLADIEVIVTEQQVRLSGSRQLPVHKAIACVHQLEIETGGFERVLSLPELIDVDRSTSRYSDGILQLVLPKRRPRGKIQIKVHEGGNEK